MPALFGRWRADRGLCTFKLSSWCKAGAFSERQNRTKANPLANDELPMTCEQSERIQSLFGTDPVDYISPCDATCTWLRLDGVASLCFDDQPCCTHSERRRNRKCAPTSWGLSPSKLQRKSDGTSARRALPKQLLCPWSTACKLCLMPYELGGVFVGRQLLTVECGIRIARTAGRPLPAIRDCEVRRACSV